MLSLILFACCNETTINHFITLTKKLQSRGFNNIYALFKTVDKSSVKAVQKNYHSMPKSDFKDKSLLNESFDVIIRYKKEYDNYLDSKYVEYRELGGISLICVVVVLGFGILLLWIL